MTKRKRTPPPSPKLIGFAIPQSLTRLATQCRELRQQAEELVQRSSQEPGPATNDQTLDSDVDAQLNAQLHASIPAPSQATGYSAQSQQYHDANNATAFRNDPYIPSSSDEEIRQSDIRDAEQQLGMINPSDLHQPSTHLSYNQFSQHQQPYYDQQNVAAHIRFDPYVPPGQSPQYFTASQLPASPQASNQSYSLTSQSTYNPYPNYSLNPASSSSTAAQYMTLPGNNFNTNASSQNPYRQLAPNPNSSAHLTSQSNSATSSTPTLPFSQTNAGQPGYYRLQPSYWQAPPPLQTSSMTEANQRHHAAALAKHQRERDDSALLAAVNTSSNPYTSHHSHHQGGSHHQHHHNNSSSYDNPNNNPSASTTNTAAASGYPDPASLEMAGPGVIMNNLGGMPGAGGPGGGVFRNLTKERFGRYSVGGKLVGAGKEIYG